MVFFSVWCLSLLSSRVICLCEPSVGLRKRQALRIGVYGAKRGLLILYLRERRVKKKSNLATYSLVARASGIRNAVAHLFPNLAQIYVLKDLAV